MSALLFYKMEWCEEHPRLMLAGAALCCILALAVAA